MNFIYKLNHASGQGLTWFSPSKNNLAPVGGKGSWKSCAVETAAGRRIDL
jgi:hypothetical protein